MKAIEGAHVVEEDQAAAPARAVLLGRERLSPEGPQVLARAELVDLLFSDKHTSLFSPVFPFRRNGKAEIV